MCVLDEDGASKFILCALESFHPSNHRFALDQRLDRFAQFGAAINVNFQASTFASGLELQRGVAAVYGTFGVHPHNASEYGDEVEARMLDAMADAKSVAVGEMGLDYHVMNSPRDVQLACFRRQLRWAVEVARKPVVLHTRDAEADTRLVLEEVLEHRPLWHIHLHCFTGSREFANWAMERFPNLFIGFTGCVTFPAATSLCDVVRDVPLRRLLLVRTARCRGNVMSFLIFC